MQELFSLKGHTALVTGASSGLGRHFAQVLGQAGARVVIGARRSQQLEETAALIRASGAEVLALAMDVLDDASIARAFAAAEERFGMVDVVVNNAGIGGAGMLTAISSDDWDAVLNTNLKAVWQVASEAARRLIAARHAGAIINISSVLGFGVSSGLGPYSAAKAGVVHLTRSMALEWAGSGIRVNAIAPGFFPTEINTGYFETPRGRAMVGGIPQRRIGDPAELSGALLLLASGASSYMTGSVITVDGGHLCRSL